MKQKILLLIIIVAILCCVMAGCDVAHAETMPSGEVEQSTNQDYTEQVAGWEDTIKNLVLPCALIVIGAFIMLLSALSPLIKKGKKVILDIIQASNEVQQAKADMQSTISQNEVNTNQITAMQKEIAEIKEANKRIEQITKIGFCNMQELVVNGYANEIEKVGNGDDTEVEN